LSNGHDELNDLANATNSGRSGGGKSQGSPARRPAARGASRHSVKYRQVKKKSHASTIAAFVAIAVMIGAVVVLVRNRPEEPAPPPKEPKPEPREVLPEVATPRQKELKQRLDNMKSDIAGAPTDGRFKPLMAEADEAYSHAVSLWSKEQFTDFQDYFPKAADAIGAVDTLLVASKRGRDTRKQAEEALAEADDLEAAEYAKEPYQEGKQMFAQALEKYEAQQYDAAVEDWLASMHAYQKATRMAQTAWDAEDMRKRFERRSVATFTKEQNDKVGGPAWKKANELIVMGDQSFKQIKYDQALKQYEQAVELVPVFTRAVQRVHGRHVWAIAGGYRAADTLLARAAGEPIDDALREPLMTAYTDMAIDDVIKPMLPGPEANFATWASVLLDKTEAQVKSAHGAEVGRSFTIGVHLRMLAKMLQYDRESVDPQELGEMRRSINTIRQEATSAKYKEKFFEALDEIAAELDKRPVFEAIRAAREALHELTEELLEYESGIEYVQTSIL